MAGTDYEIEDMKKIAIAVINTELVEMIRITSDILMNEAFGKAKALTQDHGNEDDIGRIAITLFNAQWKACMDQGFIYTMIDKLSKKDT